MDVAKTVAILAPMDIEMKPLWREAHLVHDVTRSGLKLRHAWLRGRNVVMAVSGVGKVNSAAATQAIIDHCEPVALVLTGVSGSLVDELTPGDVVVASRFHQYDVGVVRASQYSPLPVEIRDSQGRISRCRTLRSSEHLVALALGQAKLLDLPYHPGAVPRVVEGAIITGDPLMAWPDGLERLSRTFEAVAIDMEGAAVAQVAEANGVEFVSIRGISDVAADLARIELELLLGLESSASMRERAHGLASAARYMIGHPRSAADVASFGRAMRGAAENAAVVVSRLLEQL